MMIKVMKPTTISGWILAAFAAAIVCIPTTANGQLIGTAFSYQGQLKSNGNPLDGTADFRVMIWDALEDGQNLAANPLTFDNVTVTNGLFSLELDFGVDVLGMGDTWLEIEVRSPAGSGAFETLTPRQRMAGAPYAIQTRGLFVDTDGKLGVGTDSPLNPLAIRRAAGYNQVGITQGQVGGFSTMELTTNDGNGGQATRLLLRGGTGSSDIEFYRGDRGAEVLSMFIDGSNGHVGIGTVSDTARLNVSGAVRASSIILDAGADLAEPFDVISDQPVVPGMVVGIDSIVPGKLQPMKNAYDSRVAGVISGAGGINPAVTFSQKGTIADGQHPVALTGRVWCLCDADANGAISPGDMLTTSATPGHAMKVTDRSKAFGATLGKAMSPLREGKGLVLVLVRPN